MVQLKPYMIADQLQAIGGVLLDGPRWCEVWTGSPLISPDEPASGVRLWTAALAEGWLTAGPGLALQITQTWETVTVDVTGTPGYWRIVQEGGRCDMQDRVTTLALTIKDSLGHVITSVTHGQRVRVTLSGVLTLLQ